jgi:hypothetical protein
MADLRAEINRRRGAEDNCITIEHQRERHQNIEGRNLENDFDSHALVRGSLVAHAPCFPTSPGVSRGGGGGVHGAWPTPVYGGLATQVLPPSTREV